MTLRSRVTLTGLLIVGSLLYGLLIATDVLTGTAVGLGYVTAVLTIFTAHQFGRSR